ncbi:MAG: HAMP domain-containing sensor histidine kinase, partial [Myxococcota bacterium]
TLGIEMLNDLEQRGPGIRVLGETVLRVQDPGWRRGIPYYIEGLPGAPQGFMLDVRRPPIFAMEFVPKRTRAMMRRARWTLALGLAVGIAMFLGSLMLVLLLRRQELDSERLRRQELLASLGKMSAVISHELRNPLAAAMGQTELLGEVLDDEGDRALVDEAHQGLERMELVTKDLLALVNASRIEPEPTALVPWLDVVVASSMREREGVPEVHVDGEVPEEVFIDPIAMGRALDALVDNALAFGPQVRVEVCASEVGVEFSVHDHGPGLPEELSDVFQPFASTREDRPGLGLSVAREIARAHGGDLVAHNEREGAVFVLVFPEEGL